MEDLTPEYVVGLLTNAIHEQDKLAKDSILARLRQAVNAHCSCGGGDPETGCVACKIWHAVKEGE